MDLRATLCPDRLLPWVPSIFYRPRRLTALLIAAHLKIHAEHNWPLTCGHASSAVIFLEL